VVEVKDRPITLSGKRSIYKELDDAMENRDAHIGIAVVETEHAERFSPFRYAGPNYLLVALDWEGQEELPLQVAYQVARTLLVARAGRREAVLDADAVQGSPPGHQGSA